MRVFTEFDKFCGGFGGVDKGTVNSVPLSTLSEISVTADIGLRYVKRSFSMLRCSIGESVYSIYIKETFYLCNSLYMVCKQPNACFCM